jgi:hypothetical protein
MSEAENEPVEAAEPSEPASEPLPVEPHVPQQVFVDPGNETTSHALARAMLQAPDLPCYINGWGDDAGAPRRVSVVKLNTERTRVYFAY